MARNDRERFSIKHDHIILCEGVDEKYFLIYYFNSKELKKAHKDFADNVDIFDFGGNEDLSQKLDLLKLAPDYNRVKSITIFRDAEQNAEGAVDAIKSALKNKGFAVPDTPCQWAEGTPKVSFLLLPTCSRQVKNGTLEDLCLSLLRSKEAAGELKMVDDFLLSLEEKRGETFKRIFKNKLYTYLSATNEYVTLKVGEAAKANAFDWESPLLEEFRKHMMKVF